MNEDVMKRDPVFEALDARLKSGLATETSSHSRVGSRASSTSKGCRFACQSSDWPVCVESVLETQSSGREWPTPWAEPITRLIQATCWFTHRNGLPVTGLNAIETEKAAPDWISLKSANGQPRLGAATGRPKVSYRR